MRIDRLAPTVIGLVCFVIVAFFLIRGALYLNNILDQLTGVIS